MVNGVRAARYRWSLLVIAGEARQSQIRIATSVLRIANTPLASIAAAG